MIFSEKKFKKKLINTTIEKNHRKPLKNVLHKLYCRYTPREEPTISTPLPQICFTRYDACNATQCNANLHCKFRIQNALFFSCPRKHKSHHFEFAPFFLIFHVVPSLHSYLKMVHKKIGNY